jgi:hypothetical protein
MDTAFSSATAPDTFSIPFDHISSPNILQGIANEGAGLSIDFVRVRSQGIHMCILFTGRK